MLSRLRHPCVLEVVEPLEETRSVVGSSAINVVQARAHPLPLIPSFPQNINDLRHRAHFWIPARRHARL